MNRLLQRVKRLTRNDWLATCVLVALTFVLLFFASLARASAIFDILRELASIIAISGVLAIFLRRQTLTEITDIVCEKEHVSSRLVHTGLTELLANYGEYDFRDNIAKCTRRLDVVVIYGSTWLKKYFDVLEATAKDRPKLTIRFCFLDPQCVIARALQEKFTTDGEISLARRIGESIKLVKKTLIDNSDVKARVLLYKHKLLPQHSIYRFDDQLFIVPYLLSPGRGKVPLLGFSDLEKRDTVFRLISDDYEKLIKTNSTLLGSNR